MENTIYILSLGNNKYYVGRIDKGYSITDRMALYASGGGSKWVQKHGFIKLIDSFVATDEFSETNHTLRLMKQHGIDNVRGGCWNSETPYYNNIIAGQINRIIESVYNCCHLCGRSGHYSYFCQEIMH
jgi:predicted GIY-YIG superfamily endonuclease